MADIADGEGNRGMINKLLKRIGYKQRWHAYWRATGGKHVDCELVVSGQMKHIGYGELRGHLARITNEETMDNLEPKDINIISLTRLG